MCCCTQEMSLSYFWDHISGFGIDLGCLLHTRLDFTFWWMAFKTDSGMVRIFVVVTSSKPVVLENPVVLKLLSVSKSPAGFVKNQTSEPHFHFEVLTRENPRKLHIEREHRWFWWRCSREKKLPSSSAHSPSKIANHPDAILEGEARRGQVHFGMYIQWNDPHGVSNSHKLS